MRGDPGPCQRSQTRLRRPRLVPVGQSANEARKPGIRVGEVGLGAELIMVSLQRSRNCGSDAFGIHAEGSFRLSVAVPGVTGIRGIRSPLSLVSRLLGQYSALEGDLVAGDVNRISRSVGRRRGCCLVSSTIDCLGVAWTQKLYVAGNDLRDVALVAILVLKASVLHPSLNVERIALLDGFARRLGQSIPADDRVKLALLSLPDAAIGRQAKRADGFPLGRMAQFRIAGCPAN